MRHAGCALAAAPVHAAAQLLPSHTLVLLDALSSAHRRRNGCPATHYVRAGEGALNHTEQWTVPLSPFHFVHPFPPLFPPPQHLSPPFSALVLVLLCRLVASPPPPPPLAPPLPPLPPLLPLFGAATALVTLSSLAPPLPPLPLLPPLRLRYATSRGDTRSDISPAASSAPMLHASATSRSRSSKRVRWLVMLTRTTSWPLMRVVDGAAMPRS